MSDISAFLGSSTPIGGLVQITGGFNPATSPNLKLADGSDITSSAYPVLAAGLPPALSAAFKPIPGDNVQMRGVAFGNGVYVAIHAATLALNSTTYFTNIWTSTDAVTWLPKRLNGLGLESTPCYFTAIGFLNGKFYLSGHNQGYNYIWSSTNGTEWVLVMQENPKAYYYYDNGSGQFGADEAYISNFSYINGVYVATDWVTSSYWNTITNFYTSANGTTWVINTAPTMYGTAMAFGAGLYVLVCSNGTTYSSPNLTTWTARTNTATGGGGWTNVIFANGCFVSVQGYSAGTSVGYSTDGINWSQKTVASGRYFKVIYANSLFVAIGYNVCATSPDGITWTTRTVPASNWIDITYGAVGGFVAVTNTADNKAIYSTDGITWTSTPLNAISTRFMDVCYGTGLGYMAITSLGVPSISADGNVWTQKTTLASTISVATNPSGSIYVALNSTSVVYSTTDGVTWTSRFTASTGGGTAVRVRWCNDRFIVLGNYPSSPVGGRIYWSFNGINWYWADSATTTADGVNHAFGVNYADVAYGNGIFVAVGGGVSSGSIPTNDAETNYSAYSNDGSTWYQTQNMPTRSVWSGVAFGNGVFVAISKHPRNNVASGFTNLFNGTYGTFAGYNFYSETTGRQGREIAVSTNGVDWVTSLLPLSAEWSSITFNGHVFIAVSIFGGSYAVSQDGFHWNVRQLPAQTHLGSICTGASNVAVAVPSGYGNSFNANGAAVKFTESATQVTLPYIRPTEGVKYAVKAQ